MGRIEEPLATGLLGMNLYQPIGAGDNELRLTIYNAGAPIPSSDILPPLANMGLKVLGETPAEVTPAGAAGARVEISQSGARVNAATIVAM